MNVCMCVCEQDSEQDQLTELIQMFQKIKILLSVWTKPLCSVQECEKKCRDSFQHNRQNTQERLRESEQGKKVWELQLNSCYRVGEKEKRGGGGGCVCPPRWWVNICVCVCVCIRGMNDLGACAGTWQSPSRLQITLSLLSITRLSIFPVFFSFFFIELDSNFFSYLPCILIWLCWDVDSLNPQRWTTRSWGFWVVLTDFGVSSGMGDL